MKIVILFNKDNLNLSQLSAYQFNDLKEVQRICNVLLNFGVIATYESFNNNSSDVVEPERVPFIDMDKLF